MPKLIKGKITENIETNVVFAENQEEYNALPAYATSTGIVAFAFELNDEEIADIVKTKRIYCNLLTFNKPLQPICISTSAEQFENNIDHNDKWLRGLMNMAKGVQ